MCIHLQYFTNIICLFFLICLSTVCGNFPSIQKAEKRVIKYAAISSTHNIEVSVEYVCQNGYFYSLENPFVNCTENGFDNEFGKCVKGKIF